METLHQANPWSDGSSCRKSRPPKIGEIPRHAAVELDLVSLQRDARSEPNLNQERAAVIRDVPSMSETCLAAKQRVLVQQSRSVGLERPSTPPCQGSPGCSPRSCRKRAPLRECRRVSIDKTGAYLQLNQYRLMDSIGQGSYGIVKLAYNEEDDTHYAMKILSKKKLLRRAGLYGRAPPARARSSSSSATAASSAHPLEKIYREIAVLKKLDHPNVVKLVEVLDDPAEDHLYLVFELLERGQVLDVPTAKPLTEDQAWAYFRDVLLGIEYLHYQRIIHRDIKPANLLLSNCGRVQIADLGVCNEFNGADAYLSNSAGTPAFTAPEALVDHGAAFSGKAADIWSLGVTLYAFVYGSVPFTGASLLELHREIRQGAVAFPATPVVSSELRHLLGRLLERDPLRRAAMAEIKTHPWVTRGGAAPLPSEDDNCRHLVEVTDEDVARVVTSIPKLDTLILIKHMLKKHSFQNPFLHRKSNLSDCKPRKEFGQSGRSNSAPDTYDWQLNKQLSADSGLESVEEENNR